MGAPTKTPLDSTRFWMVFAGKAVLPHAEVNTPTLAQHPTPAQHTCRTETAGPVLGSRPATVHSPELTLRKHLAPAVTPAGSPSAGPTECPWVVGARSRAPSYHCLVMSNIMTTPLQFLYTSRNSASRAISDSAWDRRESGMSDAAVGRAPGRAPG